MIVYPTYLKFLFVHVYKNGRNHLSPMCIGQRSTMELWGISCPWRLNFCMFRRWKCKKNFSSRSDNFNFFILNAECYTVFCACFRDFKCQISVEIITVITSCICSRDVFLIHIYSTNQPPPTPKRFQLPCPQAYKANDGRGSTHSIPSIDSGEENSS